MSDKFSGKKPDDIPQSEWDASIAFKNRVDVASMSACEFIARARMDAKAEEREAILLLVAPYRHRDTAYDIHQAILERRNRKGA